MTLQEFDDDVLTNRLVSSIIKIEKQSIPKMSKDTFAKYHKSYLESLRKTTAKKGTFQGKYVLICFDENDSHNTRQRYLLDSATGKAVRQMKLKHEDHNYLLLHQSRAKKYGIKRTNLIWRNLA